MKPVLKALIICSALTALPACATIDEDRYTGLPCNDLKQLLSAQNLSALSATSTYSGYYRTPDDYRDTEDKNVWRTLSADEKDAAELRIAYKKLCQ